jgi:hypothetical protein
MPAAMTPEHANQARHTAAETQTYPFLWHQQCALYRWASSSLLQQVRNDDVVMLFPYKFMHQHDDGIDSEDHAGDLTFHWQRQEDDGNASEDHAGDMVLATSTS